MFEYAKAVPGSLWSGCALRPAVIPSSANCSMYPQKASPTVPASTSSKSVPVQGYGL